MIGRGCRSISKAHRYVVNLMWYCPDKENVLAKLINDLRTRDLRTFYHISHAVLLGGSMKPWTDRSLWRGSYGKFTIANRKTFYEVFKEQNRKTAVLE